MGDHSETTRVGAGNSCGQMQPKSGTYTSFGVQCPVEMATRRHFGHETRNTEGRSTMGLLGALRSWVASLQASRPASPA
jgi:hypothetical protein